MNTCVTVVTHKIFDDSVLRLNSIGYKVVKVGRGVSDADAKSRGWLCDDTGDNVSNENPYYCELTALYWNWKNLTEDITGLVHYRRFFVNYKPNSKGLADDILSVGDMERILKKKKIILPFPFIKVPNCSVLYRNKPKNEQDKHWVLLEEIIHENYPDFVEAFEHVIYDCKTTYYLNMFITTRQLMNEYCTWLFDVLKRYDERISAMGKERIPRVDGYLSETLLHIWVVKMFKRSEVCWMPHFQILESTKAYYSNTFMARLNRRLNSIIPIYYMKQRANVLFLVIYRIYSNSVKVHLKRRQNTSSSPT